MNLSLQGLPSKQMDFACLAVVVSQLAAFVGAGVCLSWLFGWVLPTQLLPGLASMKFVTAFMVFASALACLAALGKFYSWLYWPCCTVVLMAASGALMDFFPKISHSLLALSPSKATAMMFLNMGLGLALSAIPSRLLKIISIISLFTSSLIGLTGLLGYALGPAHLYSIPLFSSMAFHTALFGFALSAVMLLIASGHLHTLADIKQSYANILGFRLIVALPFVMFALAFGLNLLKRSSITNDGFDMALTMSCLTLMLVCSVFVLMGVGLKAEKLRVSRLLKYLSLIVDCQTENVFPT